MAKAYWVRHVSRDQEPRCIRGIREARWSRGASIGGRFIVRGVPAKTYEAGMNQRVVVIEFDSLQKALAAHDTKEYGAALEALGNGAERDIRIVEGVA